MSLPDSLRAPELAPLWRAVHERLSSGRPVRGVRMGPLDEAQRSAPADLLGTPRRPAEYARFRLDELDVVLHEVCGRDARSVVAELVGPLDDQAARRERHTGEVAELWRWPAEHEVVAVHTALDEWVAQLRRNGLVDGSVSRTRELLEEALRVLGQLPADGVPLPVLADRELRDPHALAGDTRVAGLVLRALAVLYGVPAPEYAEQRRELWERAGVVADELSATVLVAGPVLGGHGTAARMLRVGIEGGFAVALTLAQLRAGGLHDDGSAAEGVPEVYVVENPAVLGSALRRFGARRPPMACVSGWSNSAAILLLRELGTRGARLHYHGDFDGEGLRMAGHLVERVGARSWRMSAAEYLAAVGESAGSASESNETGSRTGSAAGVVPDTLRDPVLAATVREHGWAFPRSGWSKRCWTSWSERP
ncbi:TIGR02679 family protein [Actinopolyspora halophila]|uniref:TIGR02679 family protein n=1 Tax=Actinopolyspora halophila TaxID=1850 RepID=UPI0003A95407|nr:TIGR02679 family protein [Actinopolyspora halophila]